MFDWKRIRRKIAEGALQEMKREGQWIFQRMRKYWGSILFYLVIGVLGTLLGLAGSISSKYLIDGVMFQNLNLLLAMLLLLILTGLAKVGLDAWSGIYLRRVSLKVQNELLAQVYHDIFCTRWQSMSKYHSGDLLSRLNSDVNTVSANVLSWFPSFVTTGVHGLGSLAIMLYYDKTMTVIALLSAPVSLLLSRVLLVRMRDHNKKMRQVGSELMGFTDESFQHVHTIKALHLTDIFENRLKAVQNKYMTEAEEYNQFSVQAASFMSVLSLMVSVLCMAWGVFRLWNGYITYGTMTLFLQLARSLSRDLSGIIRMVPSAISALTSAGRIIEVTELPKETVGNSVNIQHIEDQKQYGLSIRLQEVSFSYKRGEVVLKGCSLELNPGDYAAIMGRSGCGKTTLLRMVLGMIQPDEGKAAVAAVDGVSEPLGAGTREWIAYVPQGNTIFSGSIAENLRVVVPTATEQEMIEALQVACAWEFVSKLPGGLQGIVGEKGIGLSEGQAQRIAIARAVLKKAPVILFDEATSALDQETGCQILRNIKQHMTYCTCLIVTHRTSVLEVCNRFFYMRNGHLTEDTRSYAQR